MKDAMAELSGASDIARRKRKALNIALVALALLLSMASLTVGPAGLNSEQIFTALGGGGDAIVRSIVFELRLPRALLALIVGAMLGMAGAALQGYLRNPLAEPSVLGASNMAALGAVIAFYYGLAATWPLILPVMAVCGAVIALIPLTILSRRSESPLALILAGIAISTLAGAMISLALNLSPNPFAAMEIMTWLLGSLEDRSIAHVWIALPCVLLGGALLLWDARALDALTLGEDGAHSLGVRLDRVRLRMLLGVGIGVGGAVAVAGAIGFIGLIVPHLLRPLTDKSPGSLLVPSALGGAVLLSAADILVRIIPSTNELKLGVVTAFLGVPVFFYHLMRERRLW